MLSSCTKTLLVDKVNVFVGTDGHGHTYPGPAYPFGMVQLGPDTRTETWDGCSGYHYSDDFVYGFSHTHLSGTGIADYSDVLLLPFTGEAKKDSTNHEGSKFRHESEEGHPGYYRVILDDYNVEVELTATQRCGFQRYTFKGADTAKVIIDLEYRDQLLDANLDFVGDKGVSGFRRSRGWSNDQSLFFSMEFNKQIIKFENISRSDSLKTKYILYFIVSDDDELLVKTGISGVDVDGASNNLKSEISDWNFESIKTKASEAWEKELSKIKVKSSNEEYEKVFYTSLYHSFLAPNIYSDVDGRYRGRDQKIHKLESGDYYTVFSLWDTFRAEHPLFNLVDQKRTVDFINTFLLQHEQGGLLPVWELSANETFCMIGNHAIPVIADAILNDIKGFDYAKALAAMKNAMEQNTDELNIYKHFGHLPSDMMVSSVSKTLELAYDDWCIAAVCAKLGDADSSKYFERAQYYKNVLDPATNFMRPRINGGWKKPFDPREVDFNYTEANSWQYSFFVPQDVNTMIELMGGDEKFTLHLDSLFLASNQTTGREQSDITGLIGQYAHGNEPSHNMAYLYSYSGQPYKTQLYTSRIMKELYSSKPDGLCGNEDCGQMSAWFVLSSIGFYPVTPGTGVYVFGSPLFDEVEISFENGKKLKITRKGDGIYIKSAKLNGQDYTKSWISYADLLAGGSLEFEMVEKPNKEFGKEIKDRPVASIATNRILPSPFAVQNGFVFYDSLKLELKSFGSTEKIKFSTDSVKFIDYTSPILLNKDGKIYFYSEDEKGNKSKISVSTFVKGYSGRSITLQSKYSNQYTGGGDSALIDFIRGSSNFADGKWQGYSHDDMVAIVDLGEVKKIKTISAGFLQDINSWIFYPSQVEFLYSVDNVNFSPAGTVENKVSPKADGGQKQDLVLKMNPIKARYIKVVAKNIGKCPSWHKGFIYGGDAWIFADEILVE